MFTNEQKIKAVELLIEKDMNFAAVTEEHGYPSRQVLQKWVVELAPEGKKCVDFTAEQKREAVELLKNRGRKCCIKKAN